MLARALLRGGGERGAGGGAAGGGEVRLVTDEAYTVPGFIARYTSESEHGTTSTAIHGTEWNHGRVGGELWAREAAHQRVAAARSTTRSCADQCRTDGAGGREAFLAPSAARQDGPRLAGWLDRQRASVGEGGGDGRAPGQPLHSVRAPGRG
eukprot:3574974-Rhodomonas_salina.1